MKTKKKKKDAAKYGGEAAKQENITQLPEMKKYGSANSDAEKNAAIDTADMDTNQNDPADAFQAVLYNSGMKLTRGLEKSAADKPDAYTGAEAALQELKNFHYNISFAGEQSSGKSTLINALIEYPLMPTCRLTTTCVGTQIIYGERPRLIVIDDDSENGKRVMDVDCTRISEQHFRKLKEYACVVSNIKIIENLQHFTDRNLLKDNHIEADELNMSRHNSNHVILLLLILLTVYINQNDEESSRTVESNKAIAKRAEVLKFFGFPKSTINYSIKLQWDGDFVKNGMTISDLPGFGSTASDREIEGKILKAHDVISTEALKMTDAMVFIIEPELRDAGTNALDTMLSNAALKEVINKDDIIIPVLNKIDELFGAELDQSVNGFLTLLKNAGLDKKREDIKLCSSWYGENVYKDIELERTCFYKREYDKTYADLEALDMFDDAAELEAKVKIRLRKKLEKNYTEKSYIEELKEFFRRSYVSKGKYYKAYAAVLAIIKLASEMLAPMRSLARNYKHLSRLQGTAVKDISDKLYTAANEPIGKAIAGLPTMADDEKIAEKIKGKLDEIPKKYELAFETALDEYKKKNLAIIKRFSLAWNSARIDVVPSANHTVYMELLDSINAIDVDIRAVNEKYADILKSIRNEIDKRYENAADELGKLKTSFSEEMDKAIAKLAKSGAIDENIIEPVNALKASIVEYVEQQIEIVQKSAGVSKSSIDAAGIDVANNIIQINTNAVTAYKSAVLREVRGSLKSGAIFKSRDYIEVDGKNGIKQLFTELRISSNDKTSLTNDIKKVGIAQIDNNLNVWYSDAADNIRTMFTRLNSEIRTLLDDTVKKLSGSVEQNERMYNETIKNIDVCTKLFDDFRSNVQPMFDYAVKVTGNKELVKYEGNIFNGII